MSMRSWERYLQVKGWTSSYPSVTVFLSHYMRKTASESTRDQVCDTLMSLCKFSKKTPDELVILESGEASRLVQAYVDSLANRGLSIRTVNVQLAYLKTFFRVNGFKGSKGLEVERYHQPSRYRKRAEYIPTPDEIYRMVYSAGSLRNKALVFALYSSGLRNSTLRAVLYGDVKDDFEKFKVVRIPVTPEMKLIDAGACKGNIPYYSFISREAVQALKEYLSQRRALYGSIADDEPLFTSTSTNVPLEVRKHTPVKKRSLDEIVKRAAKKAGIQKWKNVYPHCLRKAFESALRNAGLDVKDQEFLMGHILPGPQDTYYDKTKVENMRAKYSMVVFFPEKHYSSEELRKKQIVDTAKLLGFSEERIRRIEEILARHKRVDEALKEFRRFAEAPKTMHEINGKYFVAKGEKQLVEKLHSGWSLVQSLNGDKYLLRET